MGVEVPTVEEVAGRLGADPADPAFVSCYDAAVEGQNSMCDLTVYTAALAEALVRRVGNLWASRGHAFGLLDSGEFGPSYVPRFDPVLDQLEAPFRFIPVA